MFFLCFRIVFFFFSIVLGAFYVFFGCFCRCVVSFRFVSSPFFLFLLGNFVSKLLQYYIIIIINGTLARPLEPVVTECKEHTIHTQTQILASRKPKEIKHTHEGEANFTT